MAFPPDLLERLRDVDEVRIETRREPGGAVHRTITWVMVDDRDRVLVRSVRGDRGRWYREALANPECALVIDRQRIDVRAEPAGDPDRVDAATRALHAKYTGVPGFEPMLEPDVLHATLELHPR